MTADIRVEPEEFDAPWLTEELERGGVARGAAVTDVEFAGYIGTGQMSRNARFRLTWSDPVGRPATLVAKLPSADPPTRSSSFANGAYANEYTFYSQLAPTVDVCTPTCWVAHYDEQAERCVLLMEDLAQSAQGDQFEGCSPDQVEKVIEQAVALHAPRWGDPALDDVVLGPQGHERTERLAAFWAATVQPCVDRLGQHFSDDVVKLLEDFGDVILRWSHGTDTPATIVHGDFRPDNFLFATGPEAPPLAIVDWQTVSMGLGLTDLAYFIGGAFGEDERRTVERDLVEQYRGRLGAAGVELNAAACWRDYRWGTLHGVLIGVLATTMAAQTERGDRMLTLMITRHAQHAIDLDAIRLIEQV